MTREFLNSFAQNFELTKWIGRCAWVHKFGFFFFKRSGLHLGGHWFSSSGFIKQICNFFNPTIDHVIIGVVFDQAKINKDMKD